MCTSPKPHFSTCTQGMICKNNTQNKQKKPFEITSAFSFFKLLIKWNVDLGCGRFMGFVFY